MSRQLGEGDGAGVGEPVGGGAGGVPGGPVVGGAVGETGADPDGAGDGELPGGGDGLGCRPWRPRPGAPPGPAGPPARWPGGPAAVVDVPGGAASAGPGCG
jgi:hypothetical protein